MDNLMTREDFEIALFIIKAKVINPNTGTEVHPDLIYQYLQLYPAKMDCGIRYMHFKQWLKGDFS